MLKAAAALLLGIAVGAGAMVVIQDRGVSEATKIRAQAEDIACLEGGAGCASSVVSVEKISPTLWKAKMIEIDGGRNVISRDGSSAAKGKTRRTVCWLIPSSSGSARSVDC